jgi:hypothetical protein
MANLWLPCSNYSFFWPNVLNIYSVFVATMHRSGSSLPIVSFMVPELYPLFILAGSGGHPCLIATQVVLYINHKRPIYCFID